MPQTNRQCDYRMIASSWGHNYSPLASFTACCVQTIAGKRNPASRQKSPATTENKN